MSSPTQLIFGKSVISNQETGCYQHFQSACLFPAGTAPCTPATAAGGSDSDAKTHASLEKDGVVIGKHGLDCIQLPAQPRKTGG
jgi:hypothetical protein